MFYTMRHLPEQVRRNGPLWLFSAFAFESANHHLIAAVSGTIKTPEKMVELFIRRQNISLAKSTNLEKRLRSYTQVAVELRNFCHDLEIDFFFWSVSKK